MDDKYEKYLLKLIKKYNNGDATNEEVGFLEKFYDTFDLNEDLINEENENGFEEIKLSIKRKADQRIDQLAKPGKFKQPTVWIRYSAAAILLLSCSILFYVLNKKTKKTDQQGEQAQLILPGKNKAMLTLANGTKVILDEVHNGEIAKQANTTITKTVGNQIVYTTTNEKVPLANEQIANNTITTPNGGQYQMVLPDGTKVMLNAASSLTYPISFHGKERTVQLTGEAYFEVTKNKKMPFRVKSGVQTIEVLGTHFNINAYQDEAAIKTTLLEGSVKVSSGSNATLIVPGQQAVVNRAGEGEISKHNVDVEKETAWKNGLFSFQDDDLKSVMRQVARWYDVKILYADNLSNEKFIGEIPRSSNLSDVFKILELNNIHFDVLGRTVTVSAK